MYFWATTMAKGPPDPCSLGSVETEGSLHTPKNLNSGLIVTQSTTLPSNCSLLTLPCLFQVKALISEKETDNIVLPKTPLCFCTVTFLICINIEEGEVQTPEAPGEQRTETEFSFLPETILEHGS